MSSAEEILQALEAKGGQIRDLKASKPASLKDDLVPLIAGKNTASFLYTHISALSHLTYN